MKRHCHKMKALTDSEAMSENEQLPTMAVSLVMEKGELSRNKPDDRTASRKRALKTISVIFNRFTC